MFRPNSTPEDDGITKPLGRVWWCMFLILALRRQRHARLCECKASLVTNKKKLILSQKESEIARKPKPLGKASHEYPPWLYGSSGAARAKADVVAEPTSGLSVFPHSHAYTGGPKILSPSSCFKISSSKTQVSGAWPLASAYPLLGSSFSATL